MQKPNLCVRCPVLREVAYPTTSPDLQRIRYLHPGLLGTNFRAWMYRILRNTFLTSRKGLKVTMTVPLDVEEEEGPESTIERDTPETVCLHA